MIVELAMTLQDLAAIFLKMDEISLPFQGKFKLSCKS
jgi:hypothetical protein